MQKCPSCPKCHSFYSTKDVSRFNRNPLLLHCGHTFCASCLQKQARENRSTIICPACQVTTLLNDDGVKNLWPDIYTTGLIVCNQKILLDQELSKLTPAGMGTQQFRRDYSERKEKICRECCRRQATCRCDRCDFIMCKGCFNQVHSISNTLKQHQAIPLTPEESSCNIEVSKACKVHDGKILEYFCEDDKTAVCSRCVITGDHKNHSIISMEEKNKVVLAQMEPAVHTANNVIKKMKKTEKSLVGLLPDMKSETADVIQEINIYFTGLHGILQAREKQLTHQVYDAFKAGVEPLYSLKTQMQEDIKQLDQAVKAAQRVLNSSDEVVLNAREILDQLQQARDVPCLVEPKETETTEKIRFERDDVLFSTIVGHGSITGTVPCRAKWYSLSQKPECFITDDGDSTGNKTPADSVSVVSRYSEDVIVEVDQTTMSSTSSTRCHTPDLDVIPSKEKIKGSSTTVTVTHIKNPCHFWVQKCSDVPGITKLGKIINSYANSHIAKIPKHLERGDMVLAKYKGDNHWYRARVREVHQSDGQTQNVEVIYIDYGNAEKVPIDRVRTIQPKHARHPEVLIECCLHDIRPASETGSWSDEAKSTFQKMTEEKTLNLVVVREVNNVLHVDLSKPPNEDIKDDRPISVRDSLVFLELAKFISPDSGNVVGQSAVKRTFMKPEPKSKGCSFTGLVTCSGDPSAFYIQEITEDSTYFAELMGEMQDRYNRDMGDLWEIYCPEIDMPCVCKYSGDDMWYRAKVIGIPGGKQVDVQYVDFGNTERVPYWRLRKILDHFIIMSIQALPCRLSDVEPAGEEWTAECINWWLRKVTMKVFTVHVTEVVKSELSVVLQEDLSASTMNGELVGTGYAVSTGKGSSAVPPRYLQPTIDSSDECESLPSECLSSRSSVSYATPAGSPAKPKTVLRKPDTRKIMVSPGKPNVQLTAYEIDTPTRNLSPVKTSSPQREKVDTPEKKMKVMSSSEDDSSQSRPSLRLDVEKASKQSPMASPSQKSDTSDPDSPAVELEVEISHFVSPSKFYVILASSGVNGLTSLMEDLQKEYADSETVWVNWEVGSFVAARYPEDKKWYRAKIVKIHHKCLIEVFMVDFGHTAQVSPSELRTLKKPFLKQMCYAFCCHLAEIVSAGDMTKWSRTACEFMVEEIKNKKMYIQKKGEPTDCMAIDLLMEEDIAETALEPSRKHYYSLTDKLIEKGLAIPIKSRRKRMVVDVEERKVKKHFPVLHWKPAVMPLDSTILAIPQYVDFEGVIWAQEVREDDDTLSRMIVRLQEKFENSEPHTPDEVKWQVDQAAVALFHLENKWYRAKILKVEPHRIQVEFVDFGNVEFVSYDKLRADVLEFVEIPIMALSCILHNVIPISDSGKWAITTLDYMHATVVGQPCIIDIEKKDLDCSLGVNITLPDKRDLATVLCSKQMCYRKDAITGVIELSNKIGRVLTQKKNPYSKVTLAPKNEYFPVCITCVEAPNVVYFQHCRQDGENGDERTDEINEQLNQLSVLSIELTRLVPSFKILPTPRVGLPCLGQFSVDSCWYRGLIIEVHQHQQLTVLYVDYGNSEIITYDRVRALPVQFLDLPAQGIRMKLNEVQLPPNIKYWRREVMDAMVLELTNKNFMACLKTHNPVSGDLLTIGDSVGTPLQLAYQTLIEQNMIKVPEENQLFDEANSEQIDDDVIVEEESITVDMNNSSSSSTPKGSHSLLDVEMRERKKSWSDQAEEEDPLD